MPDWKPDEYIKIWYFGDGTPAQIVAFVSVSAQKKCGIEVGSQRMRLDEAFGEIDEWERWYGIPEYGF